MYYVFLFKKKKKNLGFLHMPLEEDCYWYLPYYD